MLGPLPRLHTLLFIVAVLALGVGLGAWIGMLETTPVVVTTGIAIGLGLAAVATLLLLHDFQHRRVDVVRVRRHR